VGKGQRSPSHALDTIQINQVHFFTLFFSFNDAKILN